MNTTFTNYAEKKAKQILNLLQGYTKGIRITAILILLLMGVSNAWGAQYNMNWQGKVYFLVPEEWDLNAYNHVQVDITRTQSNTESNYQAYVGNMTRVGESRLYYLELDANHNGWNQNEYIAFTANDHYYGSGTFNLNGNHYYTKPLDYGCNNANNYYLFKPDPETNFLSTENYNTISASYDSSRDMLKKKQTIDLYLGDTKSDAGGTVKMTGYYFDDSDTKLASSDATSSSSSVSYDGVVGTQMSLVATAKSGYIFEGWYDENTLLSNETNYNYYIYDTKTIIARFTKEVTEPTITISTTQQYLQIGVDKLTLTINYTNIPEGHCYRVKVGAGYFNGNANGENNDRVSISGSGSVEFTTYATLPGGTHPIVVELWESNPFRATSTTSNAINVTVEQGYQVSIYKKVGSIQTPLGVTISPTEHIGKTATASALAGYTFTGWSSNTANITFKDASALSTLVYAKSGGDIYANYTRVETYAFIQGRFHVTNAERNNQWTNTFDAGDWNENSTKIKFDYDEVNSQFYLHTYATPKELTNQLSGINPYFYIKTSTSSSSLTNATSYWSSSKQYIIEAGKEHKKELTNSSSNVVNSNLRFNTQDESGYVILYFDQQYIWYELEYTLEYNANEGTGSAPSRTYHLNGSTTTTAANNIFTRDGYAFNGWNTKADGTGTSYAASSAITMSANTTLYAQWTKPTFTVTLNQQDGNGGTTSVEATYGEEMPEATMPQREGFTFGGYFTETNGGGTQYYNADGSSERSWDIKEPKTLYAKWIQQYVIVGNGNGSWLNGANWIESVIADANFNVTKQLNNIIDGSVTYSACPAGLKNFRIVPWGTWDILHGKDQLTSCNVPSYTNEDNNIAFVTIAEADITIGFDGTNITVRVDYDAEDLAAVKAEVVADTKRMFYFGDELTDRTRQYLYVNELENSTDNHVVTETKGFLLEGVGAKKWLAVAILPPKTYNISNDAGWGGVSTNEVVQAGAIYAWYGNQVIGKTAGTPPTLGDASIRVRTANSGLTASAGGSSIGRVQTITDYYYQLEGGNTWTKFYPNNVSDLPVGIYKVHALAHDGNIYVRTAEPATLTIYDEYTITYKDQNNDDFSGAHEDGYPAIHLYGQTTELKSATKTGYTFDGWFTSQDCTGEPITSLGATDYTAAITLYAKWIQQYVIVGNGNGSWLNGANWIESVIADANFNVTKHNIIDGSVTYSACPAGLKNFRIVPWGTWDTNHGKEQLTSCNVPSYTNEDNNIAFVTIAEADITIGFDGTNITVNVDYDQDDLETVKSSVVTGENVMFYFGDEWIHNNVQDDPYRYHKYVNEYGTTTHLVTETKGFKTKIGDTDKYLAVAILPAAQYSISNRFDWYGVSTGNTGNTVQAGAIYAWHDDKNPITPTLGNTPELADARVPLGTAASGLSATCGNSSIGRAQPITDYYYQKEGESTWRKFDRTDVSDLSVGIYKVHALAYDGNIYVRTAEPATLTIYKQYYVQFNANGGEGNMEKQSFVCDETQALNANQFTREGYAFLGWSTTQNGEVEYGDKAEVTNLTTTNNATVNLYAKWQSQTPTYTINFDKQNGTNGTSSATVQYQNNNYSVNPVVAPARTDYTFGGYYTQAEGAGVQVVSAAGEWLKSVTGYTDASGNWIKNSGVTLYAKWISNSTATEGLPTGVYLVGSFGRWDIKDDKQQFKKATADATIYTLAWTFDAEKTYEFKISVDGVIRGLDNNNEITVEKTSLVIPSTGNNCKITTTEAGEYIFTWNSETNTLSVEYPSDRVTVTFFGNGGTVGAVANGRVLTSPAKVKPGTSVTFTATPDANNAFSQWKMNGTVVSNTATYTCTINADATIEAVFLKPTTVFLKPSNAWKFNNARFAIYYWKSEQDNGWVDLKQLTCHDEYYTADVPVGYSDIKFVRLNPASKDHNFNDGTCWNQTTNLTLPTNGNNLYDLTKIYLKPNANWKSYGARFAAYFFHSDYGDDKAWMSMLNTGENGVYYCDVPTDKLYNKVSFVRMNGEQSTNDWSYRLNQSKDIDLYNGSNYYTLQENKWGKNDKGESDDGMDVIYSGKWTKLELPTITITNTTPDFGDVVVKTTGGRIITNGEKVPFDTKVIVTVTPKNGYKLQTATIDGAPLSVGTQYIICNNKTINVTFAIKEEWYVIGVDGDWNTPQERFRFVDGQLAVELDTNIIANFKIAYMQGTEILNRYGNQSFSITERDKILTLANGSGDHCNIATTYYGKYIFMWDAEQKKLTVTYPLSVGDYRLAYQDTEDGSFHPERVIKKCIIGDRLDTVSFFVRHDKQPKLVLQQCATLVDGVGTWQTITDDITFTVGKTGVWNFVLQQTNNPTHSVQVLTGEDDIKPYEGDYYIRTKSAKDGWTYFRSDSHKMTYSSYADTHEPFSHYFCKWVRADVNTKNVKYTIANDYGDCISDTLAADVIAPQIVTDAKGDLPGSDGANVRFSWDWDNNELRRAYLAGSNDAPNDYLKLQDAIHLNGNANAQSVPFVDNQNWIYQLDVTATKNTKVNLTALYNESLQYFKGGPTMTNEQDDRIGLLSSDASNQITFNIRLVYDFKTNHLIVAWLPGNTQAEGALGANMMVIREHGYENGKGTVAVTQLNLTNNLTEVDTVYAVMTFDKEWIEKTPRTRDQSIYWVSFPFDVKVSDIFGFGEYADAWILQYYDGAERAEKGLFADSGTYWKYIMDANTTLKAGVGYVLVLDLNKVNFYYGVNSVSLYFPSCQGVNTISQNLSVDVLVPAHQCNIPYGTIDHTITDSHWNLIGVPAFKDITVTDVNTTFNQVEANFYYEFKFSNNGYDVKSAATDFKSMYGYMVQYAGTIKWSAQSSIPEQIAARRNSESELPEKVVLGLELVQGEEKADQTFVQLQQEGATTNFDMNIDLTKIINSGANIYTLTNDRIQAAGNALPMEESVVPVGVQIAAEGEYTFRMPDGTEGMVVELIDYETNTRTNLLLSDYIITLPNGTSENRFALHIQPQKDVVTSLENIGEGVNNGEAVNKYLIDGKLIIRTAEGVVFDAQGKRL